MKKNWSKPLIAIALILGTLSVQAQEVTLKVHHYLSPQSNQHITMLGAWCEKLAKESANKLKCQIYPAMQLGGAPAQLYDQAKDGVADVVWVPAGWAGNRFERMEVFELPFMMSNAEATSRAAWDFYDTHARDLFADTKMLAVNVHGAGNINIKDKPIKTMADLKGLKLRGPTRTITKMLQMMGATPVAMALPQVPESLAKGVIDGAVVPYEVAPSIKLNELVKYTMETDRSFNALYTTVFLTVMNKAKYESLPADLKKVMDANSGQDFSAFLGKAQAAGEIPGKEKMLASGVQISVIPKAELENWKKATDALDDEWVKTQNSKGQDGTKLLKAAHDLIKKHTK
jgi:TRAP-type C4-dicarboxylate transport system substrate-binding protein